jgi:integrase/recombinase XerD
MPPNEIIPFDAAPPQSEQSADFAALVSVTERTLSASSARVYRQTYRLWESWTLENGLSPLDLNGPNVAEFLIAQEVSKATRQRMLSALRSLAEMLSILDYQNPAREMAYQTLKRIKVPTDNLAGEERPKRALTPKEARQVLDVWDEDCRQHRRNRAIIAVLLMTGMRRSEAAALMWSDIDLEEGVIYVRHGKGDKARDVAVYGDDAIDALIDWKAAQRQKRTFVFCTVNKGDNLGSDEPMTPTSIYRVVKQTEQRAEIDHFSPHDARRTLITELLASGTPLADAQAQAGHSQGSTTLRYAQAADARRRREQGRVRFG